METSIRMAEFWAGYGVTLVVTLYYGVTAPWYKYPEGRYIFFLLASITMVLTNSAIRLAFPGVSWTGIAGIVLFGLFTIAMAAIGWGIWCAQHGRKCLERKRKVK